MSQVIRYVLDIDEHLLMLDKILDRFLPPCDRDYLRFDRGNRYPIAKAHKERCKHLKESSYYPWICVQSVVESLNMLIYRFIDNDIFKQNRVLISGGRNFCPDVDKEIEHIFGYRFPMYVDEYEYVYNVVMTIYHNHIKPLTSKSTDHIWLVEEKPTNILLVDYGNIYEYRYNEIKNTKEEYDTQGAIIHG